jgi:glycosyltransferase involved in cell wall biosynthesis
MLKVWQKVIQKNPEWMLDIYVKPNDNREIQTLVNSLNIRGNVMFHEPVKNINDKYIESSILVMTSRTEGFGMVLIEAMACGLPVLAYDCPVGPRSIITNNENGFLIEDGNIDLFIEKLNLLIENENLRIEMGNKAKENSNRYNLDTIMLQWKNLFEGLIKD